MNFIVSRKLGRAQRRTRKFKDLYKMVDYLWDKIDFYTKYDGNFYYEIFMGDKFLFCMEKDNPKFESKDELIKFTERIICMK